MPEYDLGDVARVSVEFTDILTGAFVDPSQVRVKVYSPALVISTFTHPTAEIVKDAVGKYRTDILLDKPGKWIVRWEGKTTNRAAEETTIVARESVFYDISGAEKPNG
jgi:hypothetical protein